MDGVDRRQRRAAGASPPAAETTDSTRALDLLAAAAATGDRRAVEDLLRAIRPKIVRYCRTRLGGYERAQAAPDDVAQEVCLAVLRALPGYEDQGRPFLAFVYGIAAHKVIDAHRSAGRDRSDPVEELPEELDAHDGPEQQAVQVSETAVMRDLLDRLPEKQREVLVLRVVVGMSAEETAEAVGSTAGAVRVAQHRALAKLRQLLEEQPGRPAAGDAPTRAVATPPAPPAASVPAARPGRRTPLPRAPRPRNADTAVTRLPGPAGVGPTPTGPPTREGRPLRDASRTGDLALDGLLDLADADARAAHHAHGGRGAGPGRSGTDRHRP